MISIIGNLKMNPGSLSEFEVYIQNFLNFSKNKDKNIHIGIAPPFPFLEKANKIIENDILLGAQDISLEVAGSFTGDVSVSMLKSLGVSFVIIGHSERRKNHKETDLEISRKCLRAVEYGITAVICVGETFDQKEQGFTEKVLKEQTKNALKYIKKEDAHRIVIAYEPIWAVGTDNLPNAKELSFAIESIQETVKECFEEFSSDTHILYGGSVHSENVSELFENTNLEGLLVGRSSLNVEEFFLIIEKISENKIIKEIKESE
ncbi:MAG: triose-phosphate isomerase [Candidatus Moraniibacteriota bacterium]|nr:MAG: triose-phosphate isomerase [Candidatus Moranbacteria bacterium]